MVDELKITRELVFDRVDNVDKIIFIFTPKSDIWNLKVIESNMRSKPVSAKHKINHQIVDDYLLGLKGIPTTLIPECSIGCDGDFYEIRIVNGFNTIKMRWWSCPPREWEELDKQTREFIDEIDKIITKVSLI